MNDSKVNYRAASARRAAQKKAQAKHKESLGGHFWNLVGGALVAVMISGMIYVLNAMVASNLYNHEAAWSVHYFKNIFIAVFIVYIFMPRLLANILGFIFGSKSKSAGPRKLA